MGLGKGGEGRKRNGKGGEGGKEGGKEGRGGREAPTSMTKFTPLSLLEVAQ